jgi:uncharacterized protein YbbK (DUF523 family)
MSSIHESIIPVNARLKIGVSSCLLGERVRYDGAHKKNSTITDKLCEQMDFMSICPEVAIGLDAPRKPVQLVQDQNRIRAQNDEDSNVDVSDELVKYAESMLPELAKLSGYIVKKSSPGCGMAMVEVHRDDTAVDFGRGLFTGFIMRVLPDLPVEEEEQLLDEIIRRQFVSRVFAYFRRQQNLGNKL